MLPDAVAARGELRDGLAGPPDAFPARGELPDGLPGLPAVPEQDALQVRDGRAAHVPQVRDALPEPDGQAAGAPR